MCLSIYAWEGCELTVACGFVINAHVCHVETHSKTCEEEMAEFDGSNDESPSFMEEGNCFEVKKRKLDILRQVDNMTTVAVLPMG